MGKVKLSVERSWAYLAMHQTRKSERASEGECAKVGVESYRAGPASIADGVHTVPARNSAACEAGSLQHQDGGLHTLDLLWAASRVCQVGSISLTECSSVSVLAGGSLLTQVAHPHLLLPSVPSAQRHGLPKSV